MPIIAPLLRLFAVLTIIFIHHISVPILFVSIFVFGIRYLSKKANNFRRAERNKGRKGILAQTDGFRVHDPIRVAFLHPDLGIGGAERLIVDAAVGLQNVERKPHPTSPNGQLGSRQHSRTTSLAATQTFANAGSQSLGSTQNGTSRASSPDPLRSHKRYDVQIFTNFHDPRRAFEETTDHTLKPIIVLANWIPRHIKNKGHVLFASLRMIVAAIIIAVKYQCKPQTAFDVIIVDQVAAVMPILKALCPRLPIYFYCHFPDQLCDPSRMANLNATIDAKANRQKEGDEFQKSGDNKKVNATKHTIFQTAKNMYRNLFDLVEVMSMKSADRVNYNSKFSREVTLGVFPFLKKVLDDERDILYPPIDIEKALLEPSMPEGVSASNLKVDAFSDVTEEQFIQFLQNHRVLTSVNRFERKKNINLAVKAVAQYARKVMVPNSGILTDGGPLDNSTSKESVSPTRTTSGIAESLLVGSKAHLPLALVVCGGYDPRLPENVSHHEELVALCRGEFRDVLNPLDGLAEYNESRKNNKSGAYDMSQKIPVLFLRSCTARAKYLLLKHSAVVLYTPEREHFGIVPVEAMTFGVPVVAVNNGGPVESIGVGDVYGFLRPSDPSAFAEAIEAALDEDTSYRVGQNAAQRAQMVFGIGAFAQKLSTQLEELVA